MKNRFQVFLFLVLVVSLCNCDSIPQSESLEVTKTSSQEFCETIRLQAFQRDFIDEEELHMLRRKKNIPFFRENGTLAGFAPCVENN